MAGGEASTKSDEYDLAGWEVSVLFLLFLAVTLTWEALVGVLTFINNIVRGRKATWLFRVKEEVLGLGVVSLVLLFLQPVLAGICIADGEYAAGEPYYYGNDTVYYENSTLYVEDSTTETTASYPSKSSSSYPSKYPPPAATEPLPHRRFLAAAVPECEPGFKHVFPTAVIHAAHILLFYLAIVHIFYGLLTSMVTSRRISMWEKHERRARETVSIVELIQERQAIEAETPVTIRYRLRKLWHYVSGGVDTQTYLLLRLLCEKRFVAHKVENFNFNFTNVVEQCLEVELDHVYSHAWLMILMMALQVLYPHTIQQIIWGTAICVAVLCVFVVKQHQVLKRTVAAGRLLLANTVQQVGEIPVEVPAGTLVPLSRVPPETLQAINRNNEKKSHAVTEDILGTSGSSSTQAGIKSVGLGVASPRGPQRTAASLHNMQESNNPWAVANGSSYESSLQAHMLDISRNKGLSNATACHTNPLAVIPSSRPLSPGDLELTALNGGNEQSLKYFKHTQSTAQGDFSGVQANGKLDVTTAAPHMFGSSTEATTTTENSQGMDMNGVVCRGVEVEAESDCGSNDVIDRHAVLKHANSRKNRDEVEVTLATEKEIKSVWWLHKPRLMLWAFNLIYLESSLSITISCALIIPYDQFSKLDALSQSMYIWLPMVIIDLLLALYLAWAVVPLYGLLTTAGTSAPPHVVEEIRISKTADEEHGLQGFVLGILNRIFIGVGLQEEHGHGHHDSDALPPTATVAKIFITSLARQSGIILAAGMAPHDPCGMLLKIPEVVNVIKEFIQVWHDKAWYGDMDKEYVVRSDTKLLADGFALLDKDGSGSLSASELAAMVRSLGSFVTTTDIEAMLWEIDLDGSHSVGFDEFVKFLVFVFFVGPDTAITVVHIYEALEKVGMNVSEAGCTFLVKAATRRDDGRTESRVVGMREYFNLFADVVFNEEGDSDSASSKSSGSSSGSKKSKKSKKSRSSHDS